VSASIGAKALAPRRRVSFASEYGFFFRSLHSIKVEVNGYNRRAIRVYERLGFKLVGRLREAIVMNGTRYDRVIMDLLRHELTLEHIARFQSLEST